MEKVQKVGILAEAVHNNLHENWGDDNPLQNNDISHFPSPRSSMRRMLAMGEARNIQDEYLKAVEKHKAILKDSMSLRENEKMVFDFSAPVLRVRYSMLWYDLEGIHSRVKIGDFGPHHSGAGFVTEWEKGEEKYSYLYLSRNLRGVPSYIEVATDLQKEPNKAYFLNLNHRNGFGSSNDRRSSVTITVNGKLVKEKYKPMHNYFLEEKTDITPFLKDGRNTIKIILAEDASATFLIQRLSIEEI